MMKKVYLFTDASFIHTNCTSNKTGKHIAAYAFIYNKDGKEVKQSRKITECKNVGHAELTAIKNGLEHIINKYEGEEIEIVVYSDSLNSLERIKCNHKIKQKNRMERSVRDQILDLTEQLQVKPKFFHVKAHQKKELRNVKNEFNIACDKLATDVTKQIRKNKA